MKDRTELAIVRIATCLTIAIILVVIATHYELKNLNKRLDWQSERIDRQSERIEIIFDVLELDGEIFDTLNKKIDVKLDDPEALEKMIEEINAGINAEDLTLPKLFGLPFNKE